MSDEQPKPGNMTPEQFRRVRSLFEEAAAFAPSERGAFLDRACQGDLVLRLAVEALLRADESVGERFNPDGGEVVGAMRGLSRAEEHPEAIGPYRLGAVLGQGGMGVVYEAEQKNPQRRVALKVIRVGMDTAQVIARFAQERQALAVLDHPNIAKVLDAGATERGRPYFVMEFVQGVPIAEYCDAQNLSINDRLGLFEQVCQAVQHAHSKGIIHRDLKPSNVLVSVQDGRPVAKVIDFGVAKATESKLTEKTLFTEHRQLIGTPEYMSPEQAEGSADIDTRSDIYSLGVLLYELLTGTTPFDSRSLRSAAYGEIQRIIREVDPPKPSTRLSESKDTLAGIAAKRHTEPGRLASTIRGELDWIVMKALEKDRARRYETANGLAMDVRRYLTGEPVVAAPPSRAYRVRKFVRRNRLVVGAAGAVAIALIAGLGIATTMYLREEKARQRADAKERLSTAVREYMISNLILAASPDRMGHEVKVLDVLAKASDGLSERFKDDPEVEASIRTDLGAALTQIGKSKEAIEQWKVTIPLLERIKGKDDVTTIVALNMLATAEQADRRDEEWQKTADEVLLRCRRALPPDHVSLVHALAQVGGANVTQGRYREAMPYLREAFAIAERDQEKHREAYGNVLTWLAICEEKNGSKDEAFAMRRRLVEQVEKTQGAASGAAISARVNFAMMLVQDKRFDEATAMVLAIYPAAEKLFPPESPDRGYAYQSTGYILAHSARYEESERYLKKAIAIFDKIFPEFNWTSEQLITNMRGLYSRWPGHEAELREWGYEAIKARLMLARAHEAGNLPVVLDAVRKQLGSIGASFDDAAAADVMWERRDLFAPPGHRRRAAYLANYVRLAKIAKQPGHMGEALGLAEESLSYAIEPENAGPLVDAARREAAK
ncbi:MAG: serine/threonine protein kinase [Planctomycetes bacterium]|nr:serine/threonine protein kinase [Planctomycetota bacterium]